ncbi:MAG: copper-translocating P-type ATPase [Candidatus Nanopelagicales bacterium]
MATQVLEQYRCACCRVCRMQDGDHRGHEDSAHAEGAHAADADAAAEHGAGTEHEAGHESGHGSGHGAGHADHSGHEVMFRRRFWVSLLLSVPVLVFSDTIQSWFNYTAPAFAGSNLIVPVIATAVFAYGGFPFLQMAGWEIRGRSPGMMTLIAMAITVAYVFSMATLVFDLGQDFFWELVTLIDIMLLGHWLEMRSVRQASGALSALATLMPDTADVVAPDGSVAQRPASELRTADTFLVRPGAVVPADGWVVEGSSSVDEAMITGESRPVDKGVKDQLIGGTVNVGNGSLRAEVMATGEDTALAGIMRLVADAQASKSSTQLLADRAAAFLFWAALAAASVTFLVWTVIQGGVDQMTVARVVTVLVIACPHALGLAIPLVVANTTQLAAANGVLIRDREAIDTARLLEIIAVDKTGTLTQGSTGVAGIATAEGVSQEQALALAAAVEGDSEHLMARAIRDAAQARDVALPAVTEFEILKGRGVRASIDGLTIHVGGPRLLESLDTTPGPDLDSFATTSGQQGSSVVFLVRAGAPIAAFALADVIRPESYTAVRALHERGVQIAMLTGDSQDVAEAVADELGIDTYLAQVLPADKDDYIAKLRAQGRRVGMVGDGVNDAPALTRADIGIAIGGGTDVAVQSADLVLVKSNPLDIVRILILSAASYRKQVQNIWWAAGYNIIMIPLAAGILAPWGILMPPAIGAVLMSISTIVVAINAQLLRRVDLSVA